MPADSAELTVFDGLSLVSPNRESKKDGSLHELVEQATSRTLAVIDLSHNNEYVCRSTLGLSANSIIASFMRKRGCSTELAAGAFL